MGLSLVYIFDYIMEHVIGGKFKLGRKIGSGSFGELYLGNAINVTLMCPKLQFFCSFHFYRLQGFLWLFEIMMIWFDFFRD